VKAAVVSRAIDRWNAASRQPKVRETLVHTGQHYDENMSKVFFDQLDIRQPAINLAVGSGPHGAMTGRMLAGIEEVLTRERPDWVIVYGDTNSTLAAGIAAVKLQIPIAHVEAGLRSFNRRMPEEINRLLVDHVATLCLCPTSVAVENLRREGIVTGVEMTGDVMFDASLLYRHTASTGSNVLSRLSLRPGGYILATCHRAENTDDPARLSAILSALSKVAQTIPVVLPLHPRTRSVIRRDNFEPLLGDVKVIEPVSFLDMIRLEESARTIVTDSGGIQKEAFFFRIPCITLRDETEWTETVDSGWNRLAGADEEAIVEGVLSAQCQSAWLPLYGDGNAGERILGLLLNTKC
jgi:UDP-GlcNAc3NAcA epimerase